MKLRYGQTCLVGLSFMSICAFWQLYDQIVPLILTDTFGFTDASVGSLMALDNVLALFLLPIFGALSDRTRTRMGRRMPYILVGTLLSAGLMLLLPYADNRLMLPLFLLSMLLVVLAMCVYRVQAVALMPDVTPKPLRSRGNAVMNLMGGIGGVAALVLTWLLVPATLPGRENYLPLFAVMAAFMLGTLAAQLATLRENKLVRQMTDIRYGVDPFTEDAALLDIMGQERLSPSLRRNFLLILVSITLWYMGYNAVTSAYSRYAMHVWHRSLGNASLGLVIANLGGLLSFLPVGILSERLGRKRVVLLGIVLVAGGFGALSLFDEFSQLMYWLFFLIGCGWACINVNAYPMVVDMSRGYSNGLYTGYYYVFAMLGQIISPIVSGYLLEHVGYWTLFPYAACMVALALVTMGLVRQRDAGPDALSAMRQLFGP